MFFSSYWLLSLCVYLVLVHSFTVVKMTTFVNIGWKLCFWIKLFKLMPVWDFSFYSQFTWEYLEVCKCSYLISTSSDTLTLIICCNLQIFMICQPWETISTAYMAQTKHCGYLYRNGFTCSQSPRSASTILEPKKDVLTSSDFSSEALIPWTLVSLLSPSSLFRLAQPSCPTVQCGCFCDYGPKLLSQGSHSKGFWGLKRGIRPHCRMFSKLHKSKQ